MAAWLLEVSPSLEHGTEQSAHPWHDQRPLEANSQSVDPQNPALKVGDAPLVARQRGIKISMQDQSCVAFCKPAGDCVRGLLIRRPADAWITTRKREG